MLSGNPSGVQTPYCQLMTNHAFLGMLTSAADQISLKSGPLRMQLPMQ